MTYAQVKQIVDAPEFKQKILKDTLKNIERINKLESNGLSEQEAIMVLLDFEREKKNWREYDPTITP